MENANLFFYLVGYLGVKSARYPKVIHDGSLSKTTAILHTLKDSK